LFAEGGGAGVYGSGNFEWLARFEQSRVYTSLGVGFADYRIGSGAVLPAPHYTDFMLRGALLWNHGPFYSGIGFARVYGSVTYTNDKMGFLYETKYSGWFWLPCIQSRVYALNNHLFAAVSLYLTGQNLEAHAHSDFVRETFDRNINWLIYPGLSLGYTFRIKSKSSSTTSQSTAQNKHPLPFPVNAVR
jgi:hypothetical protein